MYSPRFFLCLIAFILFGLQVNTAQSTETETQKTTTSNAPCPEDATPLPLLVAGHALIWSGVSVSAALLSAGGFIRRNENNLIDELSAYALEPTSESGLHTESNTLFITGSAIGTTLIVSGIVCLIVYRMNKLQSVSNLTSKHHLNLIVDGSPLKRAGIQYRVNF